VATAGAGTSTYAVGGLTGSTAYYFRARAFNGGGTSAYSNTANATTLPAAALNFTSGFATGTTGVLTFNGGAAVNGSRLRLSDGGALEASSVFSSARVNVTHFTTSFSFQIAAGAATADGFTFTLQGNSPTALGSAGGGLGYSYDGSNVGPVIGASVAVKFDLYDNQGEGPNSTGLYLNGAVPTSAGSLDLTPSGVDLHSGDVMNVVMTYDGTTLQVTLTDTTTGRSMAHSYTVNIANAVGGSTAFVGFTAGTGGLTAIQDILSWTYTPT
jgi:hypothetical protein